MERWKRNVLGLLLVFALMYAFYLLWLYRGSGETMVVSSTLPEWEFPFFVGAFVFGIAFVGGLVGIAMTDADMLKRRGAVLSALALTLLLGAISTIGAFIMTGYLERTLGLILILATVVLWAAILRVTRGRMESGVPLTDERLELIDLKSWALAGRNMTTMASITLLLALFRLWNPDAETLSFLLMFTWSISMIGARVYYGGDVAHEKPPARA